MKCFGPSFPLNVSPAAEKILRARGITADADTLGQDYFAELTRKSQPIEYTWPAMKLPEIVSVREIAARNRLRWDIPAPSLAQANQEDFDSLRAINKRNAEFYGA